MHTAISATPLLRGRKEPVDAILIHAGQLLLGGPSSSVTAYTLPQKPQRQQQASAAADDEDSLAINANEAQWTVKLGKSAKPVEQLKVIREANLFVSLCDSTVALHDVSMVQESGRSAAPQSAKTGKDEKSSASLLLSAPTLPPDATTILTQTKGALSLALDTSIQTSPSKADAAEGGPSTSGIGGGAGFRYKAGQSTVGRAYRPHDATQGRQSVAPSSTLRNMPRPMSVWGMEDIQREKEEKRKFMTMHHGRKSTLAHQRAGQGAAGGAGNVEEVMSVVTTLAVGCRRKLVVFRWVDGAFWDTKEIHLPHTPRTLAFNTPTTLFMGYTSSEYAILKVPLASESSVADLIDAGPSAAAVTIPTSSIAGTRVDLYEWKLQTLDIPLPGALAEATEEGSTSSTQVAQTQSAGMTAMAGAAFTGLTGYIGMANKNRPLVVQVEGGEVLVVRETLGVFLNEDGKPTRRDGIEWNAVPEEVTYVKPYVLSILPPSTTGARQVPVYPTLQVRSASTLIAVQNLPFPPLKHEASTSAGNYPSVRLLTTSAGNKAPLYIKVTPTERGAAEREGSTIWRLEMKSWGKQIDELVNAGEYQEALSLLHSVDQVLLEDREERKVYIESLYAVSQFVKGAYSEAMDHFLELDTNPARVIAMYPSFIAGPLARDRSKWFEIFGARKAKSDVSVSQDTPAMVGETSIDTIDAESIRSGKSMSQAIPRTNSRLHGLWGRRPQSMFGGAEADSVVASPTSASPAIDSSVKPVVDSQAASEEGAKAAETVSAEQPAVAATTLTSVAQVLPKPTEDERKAIDALGSFLADRRRIFKPLLEQHPSSHSTVMSQVRRDPEWLLSLPSKPLHTLDLDQLIAVAQTVDTALFKTFLATKPGLLGPLCRVENWCEVEQVEGLLMERRKFSELIALYGGKEMHEKALALLRKMSKDEDDRRDKVDPTVRYLQSLGAEHVDLILQTAHWVFTLDEDMGMEIFCADTGKVSTLPRHTIVKDLESFDERLCIRFLDYLINTLHDGEPTFHEKLATLLIRRAEVLKTPRDTEADADRVTERQTVLQSLLTHLESSQQYRAERVLNRIPTDEREFYDARALLLGRLGQDEAALRIYVDKLGDHKKAEEYCRRIVEENSGSRAFLTLLRIYLKPKRASAGDKVQLEPALSIITRYGAKIDAKAALELLPVHVHLSAVEAFAGKALRQTFARSNESLVVARIAKEAKLQTDEHLCALQRRRVKVTETRTCPRCMKRLGNSVIAVTTQGAVLHYGCLKFANGSE